MKLMLAAIIALLASLCITTTTALNYKNQKERLNHDDKIRSRNPFASAITDVFHYYDCEDSVMIFGKLAIFYPPAINYNNCIMNHTLSYTTACDYTQQCIDTVNDCLESAKDLASSISEGICSQKDDVLPNCKLTLPFC